MSLPDHIKAAIDTYIPPLDGWTTTERAGELAELVLEHKPKVIVELGTFGGRSALAMAFALRENNNGGRIFCVDPWRVEYALEGEWSENQNWYKNNINIGEIHRKCMESLWSHNIDDWLVVIRAASQHVFKLFPRINLLFVDGNHSEVASLRDVRLYVPNVVTGGLVLMDDEDWVVKDGESVNNSTKKATEFIEQHCDLIKKSGNMGFYRKR